MREKGRGTYRHHRLHNPDGRVYSHCIVHASKPRCVCRERGLVYNAPARCPTLSVIGDCEEPVIFLQEIGDVLDA